MEVTILMFEYYCPDCEGTNEFSFKVEPFKQCPKCKLMMEHIETEGFEEEKQPVKSIYNKF